jgi:hypothetical protein
VNQKTLPSSRVKESGIEGMNDKNINVKFLPVARRKAALQMVQSFTIYRAFFSLFLFF